MEARRARPVRRACSFPGAPAFTIRERAQGSLRRLGSGTHRRPAVQGACAVTARTGWKPGALLPLFSVAAAVSASDAGC